MPLQAVEILTTDECSSAKDIDVTVPESFDAPELNPDRPEPELPSDQ